MSVDFSTKPQSEFIGGAFAYFFRQLAVAIGSAVTLGLLSPILICWQRRWVASHTYIDGRQQVFDGKASDIFGKYILWLLLSYITLGIYMFWFTVKMQRWLTEHTHFADGAATDDSSHFDGTVLGYFGRSLLVGVVIYITLGFGAFWGVCYMQRWSASNTVIDGKRLKFDGGGLELFGQYLIWMLLTIVTLGIFSFWLPAKVLRWTVSRTQIDKYVP